jgi:carboxyl-terminal processing protease
MKSRWWFAGFATVVILVGIVAGQLFGERSIPENEERQVTRASRIVANLIDWLPEEVPPSEIVYDGIASMLETLDPHSSFLDPRNFERMRARQEGSFFGVGIIISRRNGQVTVIAPIAGTPAAAKGLRAGDVITAVGGESSDEMSLDDVVDRVRGPEGTNVTLTVARPGLKDPLVVEITRARIPTSSVRFSFMIRPEVGYVRLSEFTNTSVAELHEAIRGLTDQGMKRLVFDLRDNPGGPLEAAVGVSDTFLNKGQLIVTTRGRTAESAATFRAPGSDGHFAGPLVILVNTGSASASELVAGSVHDHDRGLLVGEVTWGKGLVQTVFTVRDAGLALTTARYYTPSGRCIQRDYGSFIDYIAHRNGTKATDAQAETFTTGAGRKVLGGGGITPDAVVEARLLSEEVARLFGQSAFFRFAVELLKEVPEADQSAYATAFEVRPETLDRFLAFVATEKILDVDGLAAIRADEQALTDVRRNLKVEVQNATLGLEVGYRTGLEGDNQVDEALKRLDEADTLWQEFVGHRPDR